MYLVVSEHGSRDQVNSGILGGVLRLLLAVWFGLPGSLPSSFLWTWSFYRL